MRSPAVVDWRLVGDIFVFYGAGGELGGERFAQWLAAVKDSGCTHYVGGTGADFYLDSQVRQDGRGIFKERGIPFATVTDDRLVRGFVTAGAWFGMKIAAFSWNRVNEVPAWLRLNDDDGRNVVETLLDLRAKVESQRQLARVS